MHYLFICSAALFLLVESCKKAPASGGMQSAATMQQASPNSSSALSGKWELRKSIGRGGTVSFAPGNGSVLEFTGSAYSVTDSTFAFLVRGNHQQTGAYKTSRDLSANESTGLVLPPRQFTNRLILNEDLKSDKIFYEIWGSQLVILSGYFPTDGGVELRFEKL